MEHLLILLVNLIYIPSIWYGVVNDDATTLKMSPYNVKRAKIFSILLHATVAQYIYLAFGSNPVSLLAVLLFSVHPLCVQVSVWISGRAYGLNALLFLVILTFAPISIPLYFLANKGIATLLFTPLLFLFTNHWYISLMFPILVWLSYKGIMGNITGKIKGDGIFTAPLPKDFEIHKWKPENLILVVKTFGYYALACLLPMKNGFYNSFLSTYGSSVKETQYWLSLNRHFWGGLSAIVLTVVLWAFNIHNFIGMGVLLFVLSIGPFLNFVTVQQQTAPRYAYLPLIGYQIALVSLLFKLPGTACSAILGALFLFYLDRTIRVMKHYKTTNIDMMLLDSEVFYDNPRLWYYRYEHMLHKNMPLMAWAEVSYGLKYLPEDCQLWFGLACASFELGDLNAAKKFLDTSERFTILTDRREFQGLIIEFRDRIAQKLVEKWKGGKP